MTTTPIARPTQRNSEQEAPKALVWLALALIAISLPLVINLLSRASNEAKTLQEVLRMREEVRRTEIRRGQVKEALNYAGTDAFVEYYSRAYLRWAKPGDTVIVPSAPPPTRKWWEEFVK